MSCEWLIRAGPDDESGPAWNLRYSVAAERQRQEPPAAPSGRLRAPLIGAVVISSYFFLLGPGAQIFELVIGLCVFVVAFETGLLTRFILLGLTIWIGLISRQPNATPDLAGYQLGPWLPLDCLLLYWALELATFVHELGHVVSAWGLRCPVVGVSFGSGQLKQSFSVGGIVWEWRSLGLCGQTAYLGAGGRLGRALVRLAGPVANLLFAAVAWKCAALMPPELFHIGLAESAVPLAQLVVANLTMALCSLPGDLVGAWREPRGRLIRPDVAWERGLWHLERGYLRQAERLLAASPLGLARCWEQAGNWKKLQNVVLPCLQGTFRAWARIMTGGSPEEAEAECRADFKEAPEDHLRRRVWAAVQLALGQPEEARRLLLTCAGTDLDCVQTLALLSLTQESRAPLEQARRAAPSHPILAWVEERLPAATN